MPGTGISFHRDVITRVRAPLSADRYGDDVRDWGNATATDIRGCRVVPGAVGSDSAPTNVIDRDRLNRRFQLFAPPDADLLGSDRIRWQGVDYEITGDVRRWRSVTGRLAHIEADLLRVEG